MKRRLINMDGRMKNALRGHFIAPYITGVAKPPAESAFKQLAKWITTVSDSTEEQTNSEAFYDGDGTPETSVNSVASGYSFEGYYDSTDEAQQIIEEMRFKTGSDRKVWHKVVSADGKKEWTGIAVVTAIVAGAGEAEEYETFNCTITYSQIPVEATPPTEEVEVPPDEEVEIIPAQEVE